MAAVGGTAFSGYLAYKMAQLKVESDKNALASKERWKLLDETCRQVDAKTDAQTEFLNQMVPGVRVKPVRPEDSGFAPRKDRLEVPGEEKVG